MTAAAAFTVPKRPPAMLISDEALATMPDFEVEVVAWANRVNDRAGRSIVTPSAGHVRLATSGQVIRPGRIIVIIDGERATQPTTFRVVDRLELLA